MVDGWSRAGDATWFRLHPPGLALDCGRGSLRLTGVRDVLLTHGHLDHSLGLPFLLSHHAMQEGDRPTRVLCPAAAGERLTAFVAAASALEERSYSYELIGLEPGDRVDLNAEFRVNAFATEHPVPSVGYHLERRFRRLRPDLKGLESAEIARLRSQGTEVNEVQWESWLAFCGDTGAGVFETNPNLFKVPVLMIETTYVTAEFAERGRRYGHLVMDDLVRYEERFENEAILLHHLSRRHRPEELRKAVDRHLPRLADRIVVWGWDTATKRRSR